MSRNLTTPMATPRSDNDFRLQNGLVFRCRDQFCGVFCGFDDDLALRRARCDHGVVGFCCLRTLRASR